MSSSAAEAFQEGTFGKGAVVDPGSSYAKEFSLEKDMREAGNEKLLQLFQEKIRNTYYDDYDAVIENYRNHLNKGTLPPKKSFFPNPFKKPNPYDGGRGRKSRKGRKGRKGRRGRKSRKR